MSILIFNWIYFKSNYTRRIQAENERSDGKNLLRKGNHRLKPTLNCRRWSQDFAFSSTLLHISNVPITVDCTFFMKTQSKGVCSGFTNRLHNITDVLSILEEKDFVENGVFQDESSPHFSSSIWLHLNALLPERRPARSRYGLKGTERFRYFHWPYSCLIFKYLRGVMQYRSYTEWRKGILKTSEKE